MARIILKTTKALERLAARNASLYRTVSLYYKRLIKKEAALANIQAGDKVLFIGGGPCPISGILLHEYTGAHITIIDNDPRCVGISKKLIEKLGYADFIEVLHSDGTDINPEDYTVIHMAVQVSPLKQVFRHLKKGCRFGAKILVRLPKKRLADTCVITECSLCATCCNKAVHRWGNIDSTALFVKT